MFSFLQIEIIYEHQNWGVERSLSSSEWKHVVALCNARGPKFNLFNYIWSFRIAIQCIANCNGWIGMDCAFPRDHFSVSFVCSPTEVIWASYSKIYNFGNGRLILFIYNFQCLRLCLCVTLSLSSCWSCHVSSTFWSIVRYIILDTIYHKYRAFFYL